MVKRLKLNEKTALEAENVGRDYLIFDTDVRGFSVTIYPSENRAVTLSYRVAGRQRRVTSTGHSSVGKADRNGPKLGHATADTFARAYGHMAPQIQAMQVRKNFALIVFAKGDDDPDIAQRLEDLSNTQRTTDWRV